MYKTAEKRPSCPRKSYPLISQRLTQEFSGVQFFFFYITRPSEGNPFGTTTRFDRYETRITYTFAVFFFWHHRVYCFRRIPPQTARGPRDGHTLESITLRVAGIIARCTIRCSSI